MPYLFENDGSTVLIYCIPGTGTVVLYCTRSSRILHMIRMMQHVHELIWIPVSCTQHSILNSYILVLVYSIAGMRWSRSSGDGLPPDVDSIDSIGRLTVDLSSLGAARQHQQGVRGLWRAMFSADSVQCVAPFARCAVLGCLVDALWACGCTHGRAVSRALSVFLCPLGSARIQLCLAAPLTAIACRPSPTASGARAAVVLCFDRRPVLMQCGADESHAAREGRLCEGGRRRPGVPHPGVLPEDERHVVHVHEMLPEHIDVISTGLAALFSP